MAGKTLFTLNGLTTLSFSILSFSVWYLYADFSNQDERAKYIRKNYKLFIFYFGSLNRSILCIVSIKRYIIRYAKTVSNNYFYCVIILSISWIIITKKN